MNLTQISDVHIIIEPSGYRIIELPEFCTCEKHGEYAWQAYYEEIEMMFMLDEQGFIDCPLCLAESVGVE